VIKTSLIGFDYLKSNIVGSMAEKVKAPFLQRPCDHNRLI